MRRKLLLIGLTIFLSSCAQKNTGFLSSDLEDLENTAAAGQGLTSWTAQSAAITGADLVGITDVSDTTQSDNGSSRKATMTQVGTFMATLFEPIKGADDNFVTDALLTRLSTLDADLTTVSTSDDTIPSAKATKTKLDLKANITGISGNMTALTDIKYNSVQWLNDSINYGDPTDNVHFYSAEKIGQLFAALPASGSVVITEQDNAPLASEMTTGQIIVNTVGVEPKMFYKSATGLHSWLVTYVADPVGWMIPTGTYAFYATQSNVQGSNFITNDTDIANDQIDWWFRDVILVTGTTGLIDGYINRFVRFDGTRAGFFGFAISQIAGVPNIHLTYYDSTAYVPRVSAGTPLTIGTPQVIELYVKTTPREWEFRVNGIAVDDHTNYTGQSISIDLDGLSLGSEITTSSLTGTGFIVSSASTLQIYQDCVDISSTGWLGTACSTTGNLFHETFEATEFDNAGWVETLTGTLDGNSTGPL